jgi:hypothetical protein
VLKFKRLQVFLHGIDELPCCHRLSIFDLLPREELVTRPAITTVRTMAGSRFFDARRKVQEKFGVDFADVLQPDEWEQTCKLFQKRHLLAHKMGVIDEEYVQKAKDPGAVAGRKVRLDHDEVTSAMSLIEALGRRLFIGLFGPVP